MKGAQANLGISVVTDARPSSGDASLNAAGVTFTQMSVNWGLTAHKRGSQWNYSFKLTLTHGLFREGVLSTPHENNVRPVLLKRSEDRRP